MIGRSHDLVAFTAVGANMIGGLLPGLIAINGYLVYVHNEQYLVFVKGFF